MSNGSIMLAKRRPAAEPSRSPGSIPELADVVHRQLRLLGEDPSRPGLERTPERVARALTALTTGYALEVKDVVGTGVFADDHENMILVRDVELYSLCEHHLLPFFGKAQVAYIPDGRILGLSKIPRLIDVFARRLQVQERLTDQIADALMEAITPRGVGVVVEAQHLCMMMRGVEKQGSSTVTSALRGVFRSCAATRAEFFRLTQRAG
ncbi:MAG TPA: GTP cyclohydrolase I FolE [Longimicrobiales bacterium]|nr:GTP cyclohydrolase I FolE [Longimicrobiales bacterium]